jgi:hypothetical protein
MGHPLILQRSNKVIMILLMACRTDGSLPLALLTLGSRFWNDQNNTLLSFFNDAFPAAQYIS